MSMPNNIMVLDLETEYTEKDGIQFHNMKLGWTVLANRVSNGELLTESWKYWESTSKLWKYVNNSVREKSKLFIFGNNIYFDLQAGGFFKYFSNAGWKLDFIYDSALTYILCISNGTRAITILSLTNFFEASVKELGELIGLHKMEIDFDTIDRDTLSIYCFRDVEICLNTMQNYFTFLESNDLGAFSLSRASQSLTAYRHRFMSQAIFTHENAQLFDLEKRSYYGGRTECFRIGVQTGGPFVCYDINSLYPYVMRNYEMPAKPIHYCLSSTLPQISNWAKEYCLISHVYIKTEIPIYALRIKNKVIFPVGEFDTFLCTGALQEAIKRNHITSVRETALYQKANIFSDYIDYFYHLRIGAKVTGNKIFDKYAKIFMNSLYGKFGQQVPYTVSKRDAPKGEYSRVETLDAETGENWIVTKILGKEITEFGRHPTNTTIMSIPAHVTEYARLILWRIIESIGIENVIYCDTDSVWIRKSDTSKIKWPMSDTELGYLKLESESQTFACYAPKDYTTDRFVKIKGIPKKAIRIDDSTFTYWQFVRQRGHLDKNISAGYIIKKVTKHITRKYDKGIVNSDGSVLPFRFALDTLEQDLLEHGEENEDANNVE